MAISIFGNIRKDEEKQLLIAWLVLAVAFTIASLSTMGIIGEISKGNLSAVLQAFCISLVTVGLGFMIHEMVHKFTAIHYGYKSAFRKDDKMLMVAVVLAFLLGIIFAAPGAAVVYGNPDRRKTGIIAGMAPISNLVLCIPFGLLVLVGIMNSAYAHSLLYLIGVSGVKINALFAAFNMIPISILDGKKVFDWDVKNWAAIFGVSAVAVVLSMIFL